MELRHLRYFVAVAEEGSFTKAARRLHIAQPPLSLQIQQLERELGVLLLDRSKQKVAVTEAGRALLEDARDVLARAHSAGARAQRAARGEIGRLVVGFIGSASYEILPNLVRHFRQEHPDVDLAVRDLSTAQQALALHSGDIQIGIVRPPLLDPAISLQTLIVEDFVVALPDDHRLASGEAIDLQTLRGEDFVMSPRAIGPGYHDLFLSLCRKHDLLPSIRYEVSDVRMILDLVAAGLGVAIMPTSISHLRTQGLVYRNILDSDTTEISLAYRSNDDSVVVGAFRKLAGKLYADTTKIRA